MARTGIVIDHHGRRRSKRIGDADTAHRVARLIRQRLSSGDLGVISATPGMRIDQFANDWLKAGDGVWKATTHRFYTFNLKHHILPVVGTRTVSTLRRRDCRDVLAACRAKGLKRASLRGVNRTLSAVLSQAVEDELLPANPAFRMGKHLRFADDEEDTVCPLSREELHTLLETAKQSCPHGLSALSVRGAQWPSLGRVPGPGMGRGRFPQPIDRRATESGGWQDHNTQEP